MESYVTDKEIIILYIKYEEEKPFPLKRIDIKAAEKKQKQKEFFPNDKLSIPKAPP